MKVLPNQNVDAAAPRTDLRTDKADKHAFKAVLAQVSTTETGDVPEGGVKLRKGEEAQQVEGHAYVEVTSGAREGMFINTSGNVRNGEAFVMVRKHGKEYHIYGTGKDRLVVGFHMPSSKPESTADAGSTGGSSTADLKLRKGEKIEPVAGHAYAEIVSGARSGMFINTSGNARHGDVFVLVEKADVNYHIYGSGDDRLVIRAAKRDDDDK